MKKFIFPLLYFIVSIGLFAISFSRSNIYLEHLENFDLRKVGYTLLAFFILLCLYGAVLFTKRTYKLIYFVPAIIIFLLTFPFPSRDSFNYLVSGLDFVRFHLNPYLVVPAANPLNPWTGLVGTIPWLKFPLLYGPVFLLISSLSALIKIPELWQAVYFYKLTVLLAYFFLLIILKYWVKANKDPLLALYWAVNPAVLVHVLLDGHNDIFVIMFLLTSLVLLLKNKYALGFIFFIISVLTKFYPVIFLPVFWFKNNRPDPKRVFLSSLGVIIAFFGFTKIFNLDIGKYYGVFSSVYSGFCIYSCPPLVKILGLISPNLWGMIKIPLFGIFYAGIFYLYLFRKYEPVKFIFWSFLALLSIAVSWLTPWYPLLAIVTALIIKDKNYYLLALILTAYSLLHFFGI